VTPEELRQRLDPIVGREGAPQHAPDPVNEPMIRHWCEAVGDLNPAYLDDDFAAASLHGGRVAPPAMLQAWGMPGLRPRGEIRSGPMGEVLALLDAAGYTSVVATNCRQEYARYLRPGDRLNVTAQVRSVSDEKKTALGVGRFVDQLMIYRDIGGEEVARMEFRILKPDRRGRATTPSSGRGWTRGGCSSNAVTAAGACAIRPGRCAPTVTASTGRPRRPRDGVASTASSSPTIRRFRPSTTRT
jgi:acyl dehydratase